MSTYEKLKALIVKEVPEIMDLKFGCDIKVLQNHYVGNIAGITREGNPFFIDWTYASPSIIDGRIINEYPNKFEILGRPINLADVLRAIAGADIEVDLSLGVNGNLFMYNSLNNLPPVCWDLSKDLQGQNKRVWEFLLEILEK